MVSVGASDHCCLTVFQGWRGSVKARHLVTALKDYYAEKAASESAGSLVGADKWALKYISVGRARTISEAFDDDASGFVTVQEVNNLTRGRPLDWRWVLRKVVLSRG